MVSVTSALCYVMSASCYQSRSLMYMRGMIQWNSTELAVAGLIDSGNVKVVVHTSTYTQAQTHTATKKFK